MAARITPFFLLIRRATLEAFLRNRRVPSEVAERAGLAVVRMLLDQQLTVKQVDRALIELQDVLDQNADQAAEQLRGLWANAPMSNLDDIEEALTGRHYIFAPSRGDALEEPLPRYDSDFQLDCRTEVADIEVMLLSPVDPDDEFPDQFDDEPQTPAPRMMLRGGARPGACGAIHRVHDGRAF